jgi:tetratricopeptide (TPR) repeat protein
MDKSALFSFTPSLMDGETLEAIFVQREALAADLVERIRESALTQTKLHTLIIGARGMGKTHLVSLVHHRIQSMDDLNERLLIAWLREEEWGVTSFLDVMLRIFRVLAEGDSTVEERMEKLYELSSEEAEAAGVRLLNALIGEQTLLLIAENLDDLFGGLGEQGQQKLRAFLQTHANCTILATSPRLFNGVQRRTAPFYGFFRPVHLDELTTTEAQQLLVNIARLRHQTDLVEFLNTPTGQTRVKAIQHLAGGNPRIYIIFADFLTHQSIEELVSPFMNLVDALTPYYQSRMQYLSAQQRKIVELLCEKKSPLPVKVIAQRCFMTAQTASSQLKELREKGYVRAEAIGRDAFYEITEPLMRICLGVKKERGEPLKLIVDFLRVWYPKTELEIMQQALLIAPEQSANLFHYLELALNDSDLVDEDPRIQAYLDQIQVHSEQRDYYNAFKIAERLLQVRSSWIELDQYAVCLWQLEKYDEALKNAEKATELDSNYQTWNNRGIALGRLGRNEEALDSFDEALRMKLDSDQIWNNRGVALSSLGRNEEAVNSFDKALQFKPDFYEAWFNRGAALKKLTCYKEAIYSFDKAIQFNSNFETAFVERGLALVELNHHEEGIKSYDKALKIKPNSYEVWFNRGIALENLGHDKEAIASYDKALQIRPDYQESWLFISKILVRKGCFEEAVDYFDKAIQINPDYWLFWAGRGVALYQLSRHKEAITSYDKALSINPDSDWLKNERLKAVATLNTWMENHKILETLLDEEKPINLGFLEKAVQSLFTTLPDPQQWQPNIVQLVNRLEGRSLFPELGVALVKTARELTSEFVSQAKATAWRDAWAEVVGHKPEFDLPLRLLNTALHYKQTPEDPRVFLELPTEERKILQQALGLE